MLFKILRIIFCLGLIWFLLDHYNSVQDNQRLQNPVERWVSNE